MQNTDTKQCSVCKEVLKAEAFYVCKSGRRKGKLVSRCKVCDRKAVTAYRSSNPEGYRETKKRSAIKFKGYKRNRRFMRLFGITSDYVDSLPQVCSICESTENLRVDHCHQTGKLRAILCHNCNCGLGHFKDNPSLLAKAMDYIRSHRWDHLKTLC